MNEDLKTTPPGSYASEDACRLDVVYSTKLTAEQNEILAMFEARTLNRPVLIPEFEMGLLSAEQLWEANLKMIRSISDDVHKFRFPLIDHELSESVLGLTRSKLKPYAVERGVYALMVAAPSKRAAAGLIGTTIYLMSQWEYALTAVDEAVAMAAPGIVFRKRMTGLYEWQRVPPSESKGK